jgi:hypothetical protein
VLLTWASPRKGVRSVGKTLEGWISSAPHDLDAVVVDLPEQLAGQSLLHSLSSWTGVKLETTLLATRGWPVVQEQIGSRVVRAVVALDPSAASAVDRWRAEGRIRAPLLGLTLGLRLDPAWARTGVDRLAVADEQQAEAGAELGLPAECLVPCGVPVCGGFSSVPPDDKPPLRRAFDLPEEGHVVLVVTDGLEPDVLTGALFQLSLVAERATIMFDVAADDDAADLLRRRAGLYGVEARMFGKVEEAGQLWAAADVVVARPQIYIEQRAIALRLPYVHVLPADELERETARVYVDRGIGRVVEHISTLAAEIDMQLEPPALAEARQRMGEVSRRTAAVDVARLIAQVTAQAEQILAEDRRPSPSPTTEPTPDKSAEPAPRKGPLETIGAPAKDLREPAELLVDIEAAEAEANRQVNEHQTQVDLWNRRVALASEKGAADLEREARRIADKHLSAMHHALAELGRLAERRKKVERRRGVERDFQRLEVEDALAALKKKLEGQDP